MGIQKEQAFELRICDFDQYGRIQPASVLDIFQEIATTQAEDMGIGRQTMLDKGLFWVVVRVKYEVVNQPHLHQRVVARTWPHSMSRFSFLRDYSLATEEGELLIKATSEWVVVRVQERTFASIADFYDGPTDFCQDRSFSSKPKKILGLPSEDAEPCVIVPRYTDVDMNGHVNNAKYANFVVDALNPGQEGAIRTLQIDYRHEVVQDQELFLRTTVADDGTIVCSGNDAEGNVCFACRIER